MDSPAVSTHLQHKIPLVQSAFGGLCWVFLFVSSHVFSTFNLNRTCNCHLRMKYLLYRIGVNKNRCTYFACTYSKIHSEKRWQLSRHEYSISWPQAPSFLGDCTGTVSDKQILLTGFCHLFGRSASQWKTGPLGKVIHWCVDAPQNRRLLWLLLTWIVSLCSPDIFSNT